MTGLELQNRLLAGAVALEHACRAKKLFINISWVLKLLSDNKLQS
jgi:hypothetical protein